MKETKKETTQKPRPRAKQADGESAVLAKIAGMPGPDRALGERLHAIIKASVPGLAPRLWYGMPAYAKDGKVVCFFQSAQMFKTRYAMFGFMHKANLDQGAPADGHTLSLQLPVYGRPYDSFSLKRIWGRKALRDFMRKASS